MTKEKKEDREIRGSLVNVFGLFLFDNQHRKLRQKQKGGLTQTDIFSLCLLVFSLFSASKINKGQAEKEGPRRGGVFDGAKGQGEKDREKDRAIRLLICGSIMEDGTLSEDPG